MTLIILYLAALIWVYYATNIWLGHADRRKWTDPPIRRRDYREFRRQIQACDGREIVAAAKEGR